MYENMIKLMIFEDYEYASIEDIDDDESLLLYTKTVCGDATTEEKLAYVKYEFNDKVLCNPSKLEPKTKSDMWDIYTSKEEMQHKAW